MLFLPFDPIFLIMVLPAFAFSLWARHRVTSSFKKYSQQYTQNRMTGADAAREVLRRSGVSNISIEQVQGTLTDYFDPRTNVIRLSESVYGSPSVAAVGVAAHEAGHALQYASGYIPMRLRAAIIPATNIGSNLSVPLILFGLIFNMTGLIDLGILLFGAVVVFQLITLPVEFNASRRAVSVLGESALLTADELPGAKRVLSAAALTYVGALAVSLMTLLRFVLLSRGRR